MVALLAVGTTAQSADKPTLKEAYKEHFLVCVAINRTIAMKAAVPADPKFHILLCRVVEHGSRRLAGSEWRRANADGNTQSTGYCHRLPFC